MCGHEWLVRAWRHVRPFRNPCVSVMSPWQHPQRWKVRAAAGGLGCGGLASLCPAPWSWWAWHLPCAKCWTAVSHGGCADPAEDAGNVKPACPREKQHRPGTECGRVEMTRYSACQGSIHVHATSRSALLLTPVNANRLPISNYHALSILHQTQYTTHFKASSPTLLQHPLPNTITQSADSTLKLRIAFARVLVGKLT